MIEKSPVSNDPSSFSFEENLSSFISFSKDPQASFEQSQMLLKQLLLRAYSGLSKGEFFKKSWELIYALNENKVYSLIPFVCSQLEKKFSYPFQGLLNEALVTVYFDQRLLSEANKSLEKALSYYVRRRNYHQGQKIIEKANSLSPHFKEITDSFVAIFFFQQGDMEKGLEACAILRKKSYSLTNSFSYALSKFKLDSLTEYELHYFKVIKAIDEIYFHEDFNFEEKYIFALKLESTFSLILLFHKLYPSQSSVYLLWEEFFKRVRGSFGELSKRNLEEISARIKALSEKLGSEKSTVFLKRDILQSVVRNSGGEQNWDLSRFEAREPLKEKVLSEEELLERDILLLKKLNKTSEAESKLEKLKEMNPHHKFFEKTELLSPLERVANLISELESFSNTSLAAAGESSDTYENILINKISEMDKNLLSLELESLFIHCIFHRLRRVGDALYSNLRDEPEDKASQILISYLYCELLWNCEAFGELVEKAEDCISQLPLTSYELQVFTYFIAEARLAMGNKSGALEEYKKILSVGDFRLAQMRALEIEQGK